MEPFSRHIVRHAHQLASEVGARAVVVYAAAIVRRSKQSPIPPGLESHTWVAVPKVHDPRRFSSPAVW